MEKKPRVYRGEPRLTIGVMMLLIAGAAVGLWLTVGWQRARGNESGGDEALFPWLYGLVFVLGGLSLAGVPLLLLTARRRHWGAGRFLWFTQGTAAWILWPPIVFRRVAGSSGESMTDICFFFGTPPMALYVTLALLAAGRLNRSGRRRLYRSWQETFGLLLGLAWACTGLYLISLFYRDDIFKK
jgi:hypothetical protein